MIDPRRWATEAIPHRQRRKPTPVTLVRPSAWADHGWTDDTVGLGESGDTFEAMTWEAMPEVKLEDPAEQGNLLASSWADMPEIAPGGWAPQSSQRQTVQSQAQSGSAPAGGSAPLQMGDDSGGIYEIAFGFDQPYTTPFNAAIPRHRGVDLIVPGAKDNGRGSPVRPFRAGTVVAVTTDPVGGNGVILQGDDGLYHRYFHFDAIHVKQGQRVDNSTPLGILGASGTEGFPHVHFEVSRGINGDPMGQTIDPRPYMNAGVGRGEAAGWSDYGPEAWNVGPEIPPSLVPEERAIDVPPPVEPVDDGLPKMWAAEPEKPEWPWQTVQRSFDNAGPEKPGERTFVEGVATAFSEMAPNVRRAAEKIPGVKDVLDQPSHPVLGAIEEATGTDLPVSLGDVAEPFMDPTNLMPLPVGGTKAKAAQRAPGFFSQLRKAVEAIPQERLSAEQLGGMLRKAGVKPEEMKWTGLDDLLAGNKQVTKSDVLAHLDENAIEVHEIVKGEPKPIEWETLEDGTLFHAGTRTKVRQLPNKEYDMEGPYVASRRVDLIDGGLDFIESQIRRVYTPARNDTRHGSYVVPGGENYRELLLTLPPPKRPDPAERDQVAQIIRQLEPTITKLSEDTIRQSPELQQMNREYWDAIAKLHNIDNQAAAADTSTFYNTAHWDEPQILAHVRFTDRTDDAGRKTLFLEEIQSDWHQAGRKEGYLTKELQEEYFRALAEVQRADAARMAHTNRVYLDPNYEPTMKDGEESDRLFEELAAAQENLRRAEAGDHLVPPAPFEKTWPELTLKRMIRHAAENGYDSIAWTPGSVHAPGRWGTERITWEKRPLQTFEDYVQFMYGRDVKDLDPETWDIEGLRKAHAANNANGYALVIKGQHGGHADGFDIEQEAANRGWTNENAVFVQTKEQLQRELNAAGIEPPGAREIAEGRTLADKLWNRMQAADEGEMQPRAEGMAGFYDNALVNAANKLVKKFGARVEPGKVSKKTSDSEVQLFYNDNPNLPNQLPVGWAVLDNKTGEILHEGLTEETQARQLAAEAEAQFAGRSDQPTWSIQITPEMRKAAMEEGFPLFVGVPRDLSGDDGEDVGEGEAAGWSDYGPEAWDIPDDPAMDAEVERVRAEYGGLTPPPVPESLTPQPRAIDQPHEPLPSDWDRFTQVFRDDTRPPSDDVQATMERYRAPSRGFNADRGIPIDGSETPPVTGVKGDTYAREPEFRKQANENLTFDEKIRRGVQQGNVQLNPLDMMQGFSELGERVGQTVLPNEARTKLPSIEPFGSRIGPGEVLDVTADPTSLLPFGGPAGAAGMAIFAGLRRTGTTIMDKSANPATQAVLKMYREGQPVPGGLPELEKLAKGGIGNRINRALWDADDLAKRLQDSVGKALGRPLRPGEMWYELRGLDPVNAADQMIEDGLMPAFRGADNDVYETMLVLGTLADNVDKARAAGVRSMKEYLGSVEAADAISPKIKVDLNSAQQRLGVYTRHLASASARGDLAAVANYSARVADANVEVRMAQQRYDEALRASAARIRHNAVQKLINTAEGRQFSGGINLADSEAALVDERARLATEAPDILAEADKRLAQYRAFRDEMREKMVEWGVWSRETADKFATDFPNYMRTRILDHMSEDDKTLMPKGRSFNVGDLVHKLTPEGTGRAREDPFASYVREVYQMARAGFRNKAFNAFTELWNQSPDFQKVFPRVVTAAEVNALRSTDPAAAKALAATGKRQKAMLDSKYDGKKEYAVMRGMVDGQKVEYLVPSAFKDIIELPSMGSVDILKGPMRLFHMAVIQRNPLWPAWALANDALGTAGITSASRLGGVHMLPRVWAEYARVLPDVMSGFLSGTHRGDLTSAYRRGGGGMFGGVKTSRKATERSIKEMRRDKSIAVVDSAEDLGRWTKGLFGLKWAEHVGERLELLPRIAEYSLAAGRRVPTTNVKPSLLNRPGTKAPVRPISNLERVIAGRTVSLDFQQGGVLAKYLSNYIPFFNPGMQSSRMMAKVAAQNPAAWAGVVSGYVGGLTMLSEWWNREDPERELAYEGVPQWRKDQGIIFMVPGETDRLGQKTWHQILIPMREYSPLVMAMRRASDAARGDNSRDWTNLAVSMAMTVSPVRAQNFSDLATGFVPFGLQTPLQLANNYDAFRGQEIVTDESNQRAGPIAKAFASIPESVPVVGGKPAAAWEFIGQDLGAGPYKFYSGLASELGMRDRPADPAIPQELPVVGGPLSRFAKPTGPLPSQTDVAGKKSFLQEQEWRKTGNVAQSVREYDEKTYEPARKEILARYEAGGISHAAFIEEMQRLRDQRRGYQTGLESDAGMTPEQRDAIRKETLDSPTRQKVLGKSIDIPENKRGELQTVLQKWRQAGEGKTLNPAEEDRAKRNVLDAEAVRLGIEPNALLDYLKAAESGRTVPDVKMSEGDFNEVVNRYFSPTTLNFKQQVQDPTTGQMIEVTNPGLLREAQRREIAEAAKQYGVDPDDLLARIQVRISKPDATAVERSLDRGFEVAATVNDPLRYPKFIDKNGQSLTDSPEMEAELGIWLKAQTTPTRAVQQLKDAEKRGNLNRYLALLDSPHIEDYERWFGVGRQLTDSQWEMYRSGNPPRYRGVTDPQTQWDMDRAQKIAAMAPKTDPIYRTMYPIAVRARMRHDPRFRAYLEYDEFSGRKLSGEFAELDASMGERSMMEP